VRTLSGAERTLIGGSRFDVHLRAFIRDAGGTFRDLTNVHGARNWLLGVTIRESLDSPSATASVTLSRTEGGLSIAPGVSGSSANTGGAFLDVGRELYVETACVSAGAAPAAGDWRRVFWGRVDRLDTGDRERITLECRDLSGRLTDLFLEAPYQVPAVAIETAIQGLLDASPLGNIVTLATPVSPAFTINAANAPRLDAVSLFTAARQLASQVGWDLRYRWTGSTTNELRFFQPDRAKTTPDLTIGPGEYLSVRSWAAAIEDVRNVVSVQYRDATGLPATEVRSNSASITAYGRRAMRLGGDTTGLIRTQAQAQALADAVLADLALPSATHQIETLYLWPVELGDLWRFSANAVHYDGNQDYAVVAIEHELTQTRHRTRVTARGKPAARYYGWLRQGLTSSDIIAAAITNAAPGGNATQAEISYSASGGTLTVLRNGAVVTPGASPWVVNRPSAGNADVYEFIQTAGAVRESVLVTVYSNEMFSGSGYVGGSGTPNRLARWASSSTLADSVLEDDGTHAFPSSDATRDLGTAARRWRDIRASRDVIAGGKVGVGIAPELTLDASAENPTRGIVQRVRNGAGSSLTGSQLQFTQNTIADWTIGQPAGVNAFGVWRGRNPVADGVEMQRFHASGGISLLDSTDPGAGVVRVGGILTATGNLRAGLGAIGFIEAVAGTGLFSGYAQFMRPDGTRVGYIGFAGTSGGSDTGTIPYVAGTHDFTGNVSVGGVISGNGSGLTNLQFDDISVAGASARDVLQVSGGAAAWGPMPLFNNTQLGAVPASGGGTSNFLRADGTWAAPSVATVSASSVTAGTFSGASYIFSNAVRFDSGLRLPDNEWLYRWDGAAAVNGIRYNTSISRWESPARWSAASLGTGTADSTTYLRGDGTWQTPPGATWTVVTKTADENKANTATTTDDPDLAFNMAANTRYQIRGRLHATNAGGAEDFAWRHAGPASPTFVRVRRTGQVGASGGAGQSIDTAYSSANITVTGTADTYFVEFEAVIENGSTSGNFRIQWAQATSGATNTTLLRGSYLEYRAI